MPRPQEPRADIRFKALGGKDTGEFLRSGPQGLNDSVLGKRRIREDIWSEAHADAGADAAFMIEDWPHRRRQTKLKFLFE